MKQTIEPQEKQAKELWAWGLVIVFFTVLAIITFRCAWGPDNVFSASDLNIGRLAAKKNYLPESLTGSFAGNQVMGSSGYGFTLFNVLLALMSLTVFANIFYGLVLVFGSISMVWFLRIWGRSWTVSVFGALAAFWFNSITLASGGHAYKMEVLAYSVLTLALIEKAVRSERSIRAVGFALLGGCSVGLMLVAQQDVALLAGLFVGAYAIFRLIQRAKMQWLRWGSILLPVAMVALLLSGTTVLKSYQSNIAGAVSVQNAGLEKWNYITQWSMVPGEWPDLIAPGWSGWSTGDSEGPYWGKIGRSAGWERTRQGFQNFRLDSIYIGVIPFLLAGIGMMWGWKNRKSEEGAQILFWMVAGLAGLWLAFGKYSPLYKLFFQLPLVSNIRAPIKLLDNFQICLAIIAAFGLDRLMADGKAVKSAKALWIACASCGGLMLLAGLKLLSFPNTQKTEVAGMGYERFADVIVENMANAWFHAAMLALICGALIFVIWKGMAKAKWVVLGFVAVMAVDSLMVTSHYFRADDISTLKKGNVLINYLKENQGEERTFFVDQTGIYNQWLASDGPFHGLNLFNIWQMPRMPVEYKEYLGKVGRNQIRLWELSSIKHIAAPASIMHQLSKNPEIGKRFKPVLNYQVPTAQGMRKDVLFEFSGSVPRLALYQGWEVQPLEKHCEILAMPQHDFRSKLLVDSESGLLSQVSGGFQSLNANVTKKSATVDVDVQASSIVRFSQRIQPGWKVYVDGKIAELMRVDYLCMGVLVPSGAHTVEFRCVDGTPKVAFSVAVFVLSLAGGLILVFGKNRKSAE